MRIALKSIPEKGLTLRGTEESTFIKLTEPDIQFPRPVSYDLDVRLVGKLLVVKGSLSSVAELRCSRCLKKFKLSIKVPRFKVHLEVEDSEGVVDLTEKVREDIILSLPYKPLCSEACRGLCPICGRSLNEGSCRCAPNEPESPFHKLAELQLNAEQNADRNKEERIPQARHH